MSLVKERRVRACPRRRNRTCLSSLAVASLLLWASGAGPIKAQGETPVALQNLADTSPGIDPNVALFYGKTPAVEAFKAFDLVIIDPQKTIRPDVVLTPRTEWGARVRVGRNEVDNSVASTPASNATRNAVVSDVAALWADGYRTFLLDDGVALGERDPQAEALLIRVLDELKAQVPQARLYLRNHLDIARTHVSMLSGSIVDSLYRSVTLRPGYLADVTPSVRQSAVAQIAELDSAGLEVVVLDYCLQDKLQCRRELAQQLQSDGLKPYVTSPGLDAVGIGRIEVLPRKIAVIQSLSDSQSLMDSPGVRYAALPLNYLGYDLRHINADRRLPDDIAADRYAGIVVVMDGPVRYASSWRNWLLGRVRAGVPVAVLGDFGFPMDGHAARMLGLKAGPTGLASRVDSVVYRASMMGFEMLPVPDLIRQPLQVQHPGRPLLSVRHGSGQSDMAALTSWGGYALHPYSVVAQPALGWSRWAINPLSFFRQALRLPDMPVPDVTTENGRRLMFVQVSDEGLEGRSEFPGTPYNAEVMYTHVLRRYKVPSTIVPASGVDSGSESDAEQPGPAVAPGLSAVTQKIQALPYVRTLPAVAVADAGSANDAYGVTSDRPEVRMVPNTAVLTHNTNSWTRIAPYGVTDPSRPDDFQVVAPGASDYAYFGSASGPFYRYRQVLESFELSDQPYRFSPVHLLFHAASLGKAASLQALNTIFAELLDRPVLPIYAADYIDRVHDWQQVSVARQGDQWIVRSGPALRQLRWSGSARPAMGDASGLAGFASEGGVIYLHMGSDEARFRMTNDTSGSTPAVPYVAQASGFIRDFQRQGRTMQFRFGGYYRPFLRLADAKGCDMQVDGRPIRPQHAQISVPSANTYAVQYHTIEVTCG